MTPWLDDGDLKLYHGDCLEVLRGLPDRSVHMCATSPPFYGLRDYGVDGQIGLEESPDQWVERLVEVFREVRRVLRDDGTLWVEIGDSYCANQGRDRTDEADTKGGVAGHVPNAWSGGQVSPVKHPSKPKDLLGQPWLLAFALRADGWYLRSEIIWARPNPMPESVTDRPTKAHSTIFLLSKQPRYFYDADAIREAWTSGRDDMREKGVRTGTAYLQQGPVAMNHPTIGDLPPEAPRGPDGRRQTGVKGGENSEQHRDGERWPNPAGANARSVWTVPTEPTPFAHFATWPQKLVARMVKAGTSEKGCCPECGAPWERITGREGPKPTAYEDRKYDRSDPHFATKRNMGARYQAQLDANPIKTLGWQPSCSHDHPPVPCVVLDIFAGSGTTLKVARDHGRHSVGIELNEQYLKIAADRLAQQSLLTGEAA